jgi:hypothetical protein
MRIRPVSRQRPKTVSSQVADWTYRGAAGRASWTVRHAASRAHRLICAASATRRAGRITHRRSPSRTPGPRRRIRGPQHRPLAGPGSAAQLHGGRGGQAAPRLQAGSLGLRGDSSPCGVAHAVATKRGRDEGEHRIPPVPPRRRASSCHMTGDQRGTGGHSRARVGCRTTTRQITRSEHAVSGTLPKLTIRLEGREPVPRWSREPRHAAAICGHSQSRPGDRPSGEFPGRWHFRPGGKCGASWNRTSGLTLIRGAL